MGQLHKNLNDEKPRHVAKTTELSKGFGRTELHQEISLFYFDSKSSVGGSKICFALLNCLFLETLQGKGCNLFLCIYMYTRLKKIVLKSFIKIWEIT